MPTTDELLYTNLVANSGLDATPYDWNWGGGFSRTVAQTTSFRHTSGNAMRVTPTTLGAPAYVAGGVTVNIPVTPGKTYRAGVWARYPSAPSDPRSLSYMISQFDAAGNPLTNAFPGPGPPVNIAVGSGTRHVSTAYVPASNVARVHVYVHVNGDGTNEPFDLEDLLFMEWDGTVDDLPDFDGDTAPFVHTRWTGEPYLSTSEYYSLLYQNEFAKELYGRLEPLTFAEAQYGYPLLQYVNALADQFGEVELYGRGDGDAAAWTRLFDVDRVPSEKELRWLAQFAGVRLTQGLSFASLKTELRQAEARRRGTPAYLVEVAQRYLTGNKYVFLKERDTSAYSMALVTRAAETPNAAALEAAVRAAKPAGLAITFAVTAGVTWNEATSTWNATGLQWDQALNTLP